MAEIVNLRHARKRKAREDDAARAAENRARFGVAGPERRKREAEAARAAGEHAGHKVERHDKE